MTPTASLARQVRRLQAARRRWRDRVAAKQQELHRLRITVRDLTASRALWKQRYRDLQHQLTAVPSQAVLLPLPTQGPEVLPGEA
jgi:hypothetical protein